MESVQGIRREALVPCEKKRRGGKVSMEVLLGGAATESRERLVSVEAVCIPIPLAPRVCLPDSS